MNIEPNHPKQQFAFLLRNEPTPDLLAALKEGIEKIATLRSWTLSKPRYFESEISDLAPKATLYGGCIEIYSALPPWGRKLPPQIDKAHFDEVNTIVTELCKLSQCHKMAFQIEIDGTVVGGVKEGVADKMLTQGLLEPWRQAVES